MFYRTMPAGILPSPPRVGYRRAPDCLYRYMGIPPARPQVFTQCGYSRPTRLIYQQVRQLRQLLVCEDVARPAVANIVIKAIPPGFASVMLGLLFYSAKCDSMSRRYTENEWVIRARERHGERYAYAGCGYRGMNASVKITCLVHGPFSQRAQDHILGSGCPQCAVRERQTSNAAANIKRRVTTEAMVARFTAVHGDVYDYTAVRAESMKKPVTIRCREHGSFRQSPSNHLRGSGCPCCSARRAGELRRLDQAEFEKRVHARHADRYELSSAVYITQYDSVVIGCLEHGPFPVLPFNLWAGTGCPDCAHRESGQACRVTQSGYLQRASAVHGERYDYSLLRYTRMHDPITVVCRVHGPFAPTAANFLAGRGCPACGVQDAAARRTPKLFLPLDEVLARFRDVHGERYDYSNVVYQYSMRRVKIGCFVYGPFWQRPAAHWLGKGCPACGCAVRLEWAAARVLSTSEAVRRFRQLHGDRYDYSQACYQRYCLPLSIVCTHHGLFRQTPQAHLEGKGCPQCAQSSGETRAAAWLRQQGIAYIAESSVPLPGPEGAIRYGRFDFYLPKRGGIRGNRRTAPLRTGALRRYE